MPRTRSIKWSELKLGVVGVAAFGLAAALIFAVGGQGGFFWQRYPLHTRFADVGGLKTGAVVRLNGMEVGKVTTVEFAGSEVEVGLEVSRDVRHLITSDSEASMGTLSLLGEPIVDIRAASTGAPLPDGGFVTPGRGEGVSALAANASRTMDQAGALLADVRAGRGTVGKLFADDALEGEMSDLMASAARVARHLDAGKGTLGALANDPGAYLALESALDNLARVTARVESGPGPMSRLLNDEAMGRSLAGGAASFDQIAGRLARGEGSAGKLLADEALYDRVNELTLRLDRMLGDLESGSGSASRLLNDEALYDNANGAVLELRSLIADVQRDPKKYLTVDFSVF